MRKENQMNKGKWTKRALPAVLLVSACNASAMLFCYNSANDVQMTWTDSSGGDLGVTVYQIAATKQIVTNPGPQLLPFGAAAYCWANGSELNYVYANFPDLKYPLRETYNPKTGAVTFRTPVQPGAEPGTVYWTGEDAMHLINNF
jgi:hypothetical protein